MYDREYTPAGCSRLKMDGRCPVSPGDDPICDKPKMKHPLSYVWWKQRDRSQAEESSKSNEESAESANLDRDVLFTKTEEDDPDPCVDH